MVRTFRLLGYICALAVSAGLAAGQDVPQGVSYKKASAEVNAEAKAALEQALQSADTPKRVRTGTISCGPILWNDLADHREELSKDSTPVMMMLTVPEPVKAEGRGLRTQEQRDRFWKLVVEKFPALRKGTVRIAK